VTRGRLLERTHRPRWLRSRSAGVASGVAALLLAADLPCGAEEAGDAWSASGLYAQRVRTERPERPEKEEILGIPGEMEIPPNEARKRSPGLAFLFSAAVPGGGQFYNGQRRGLVYLAVEAAAWIAHLSFRSSGNDKETEYKRFADGHWDLDRYREAAGDTACFWSLEADSLIVDFSENNRQHYYEDIGKLESYSCGWDSQTNRTEYRDLRGRSNDLLRSARTARMVVFLNHLVSAIDAFRSARSMNVDVARGTELRMDVLGDVDKPRAVVRLVHQW